MQVFMSKQSTLRRRIIPLTLLPLLGLCAVLLFATLLISFRIEKSVADLTEQRSKLLALEMVQAIEAGLRFGILIEDQAPLEGKLQALMSTDTQLLKIRLFDDQGKPIINRDLTGAASDLAWPTLRKALNHEPVTLLDRYVRTWRTEGEQHVLLQARNAMGVTGGVVWVVYATQNAKAAFAETFARLLRACLWMMLAGALIFSLFVAMIWYPWEEYLNTYQSALGDDSSTGADSPIPGVSISTIMKEIASAEGALQEMERKVIGSRS